ECKEQIHRFPGALFKSFEIKQQAEDYVNNMIEKENIFVWTDGCCENNGKKDARAGIGVYWSERNPLNLSERLPGYLQTNNRAEIFAVIRAIETCIENDKCLVIYTDSIYVINCQGVKNPKKNLDLVIRLNDLIKERKGKVVFKYVRGHRGNEGNEQADKLAYLGSQKPFVELVIPESLNVNKKKRTIKDYFKNKDLFHMTIGRRFNNVVSETLPALLVTTESLAGSGSRKQSLMLKLCLYCKQDNHPISDCHIVEYLQVKVLRITKKGKNENFKENQNFLVDRKFKKIIRSHKWYKKETDIVDENNQNFVNHMFPDIKIDKIKFKNNYSFDL
ncbi:4697_t:CDS:2, partial [Scutellospora calospora]